MTDVGLVGGSFPTTIPNNDTETVAGINEVVGNHIN